MIMKCFRISGSGLDEVDEMICKSEKTQKLGAGIPVKNKEKWLNCITVVMVGNPIQ
jgi:hypothetical protein